MNGYLAIIRVPRYNGYAAVSPAGSISRLRDGAGL